MELYLIRHGETDWNASQQLQGQKDIPLNSHGIELAKITARALQDIHFDVIYSSPLIRALQTARIMRGDKNTDIITDDRLREISFGDYEGVPSSMLPADVTKFFDAPELYVAPPHGESYEHLIERAGDFLNELLSGNREDGRRVLVVGHGALNRALSLVLENRELKDIWKGKFSRNCCVSIYDITGDAIRCIEENKIYYEETELNFFGRK